MQNYSDLLSHLREIDLANQIGSLLGWDQEVIMPKNGAESRAEHLAWISKTVHEKITDPRIGELITSLEVEDLDEIQRANVRISKKAHQRATCLPSDFVEDFARLRSQAHHTWAEAREKDDFSLFRDDLSKILDMTRRKAEYFGYTDSPYNALLDQYETGLTVGRLDPLFNGLRDSVSPLVRLVSESGVTPDNKWVNGVNWPKKSQEMLSQKVSESIGFDFNSGRRDSSVHPFCGGPNPFDVRWTTRYDESEPFGSLFGSMHETGHGTYEQGRPESLAYQPAGKACGLGIHESQSRLWENQIGRSLEFCEWVIPLWREFFPGKMDDVTPEMLWRSVNQIQPSFIRTESDEATYNLHIMIRYELEKMMIEGDIEVDQIPDIWNEYYDRYLGISPPNRKLGVLQDIHWCMGAIGYFPTYTLGNLYAAQLLESARNDIVDHDENIRNGMFGPLLDWMRKKIHTRGSILEPAELIEEATGRPPTPEPFVSYLASKVSRLYGIKV
ncbi:MAG: carboxypeptidase M32 [Euryarchaeota archaeon]|jgi:carboxypeptidase Taq